jgi:type II secretory pathway predicted ATPase ExeA
MYQHFYGLRELPFELTPNPRYLFFTAQHREALTTLEYGLFSAKGVTVLIGEAGTGKTTLIHAALESERCRNVTCVYINNPALTRQEFVETLSLRFGLSSHAGASKAALIEELEPLLRERRSRGLITALVVDEAQSLTNEVLEEIRLLANSETTTQKLLPFVLSGQPELKDRLNEPGLRQLKQRVTLRCEIRPFTQQETAAYIEQRIRTAGGEAGRLFTREAVMLIHERSGGIPRTISVMCDNALLTGFGLGRTTIDSSVILEVARDFDLPGRLAAASSNFGSWSDTGPETDDAEAVAVEPARTPDHAAAPSATLHDIGERELASRIGAPLEPAPTGLRELQERSAAGSPEILQEHDVLEGPELFAASSRKRRFSLFGGR